VQNHNFSPFPLSSDSKTSKVRKSLQKEQRAGFNTQIYYTFPASISSIAPKPFLPLPFSPDNLFRTRASLNHATLHYLRASDLGLEGKVLTN
jgi:hypothetical protein